MTGDFLFFLYFILAAIAVLIVLQPEKFVVTRSAIIDAPPKKVFGLINDLKKWKSWSPWAEKIGRAHV